MNFERFSRVWFRSIVCVIIFSHYNNTYLWSRPLIFLTFYIPKAFYSSYLQISIIYQIKGNIDGFKLINNLFFIEMSVLVLNCWEGDDCVKYFPNEFQSNNYYFDIKKRCNLCLWQIWFRTYWIKTFYNTVIFGLIFKKMIANQTNK